jgi:hypothetical protein
LTRETRPDRAAGLRWWRFSSRCRSGQLVLIAHCSDLAPSSRSQHYRVVAPRGSLSDGIRGATIGCGERHPAQLLNRFLKRRRLGSYLLADIRSAASRDTSPDQSPDCASLPLRRSSSLISSAFSVICPTFFGSSGKA